VVSARAWSFYETALAPLRRPIARPTVEQTVRRDDRDAVERLQRVKDLLGEAVAYRNARRLEWADAALAEALTLDPESPDALAVHDAWAADPAPPLTEKERAVIERENRLYELLGAAISILDADPPASANALAEAAAYVREALDLAPADPTAVTLAARLDALPLPVA
jgi:tetratricopeptide (TPR) repeat protein